MNAARRQTAIARLLTDANFRIRLLNHDDGELPAEFALSDADLEYLRRIAAKQLESHARSLIRKRAGIVRAMLPATATALSQQFAGWFDEYAASKPLDGERRYLQDALDFSEFVSRRANRDVIDAVRVDRLRLKINARRFALLATVTSRRFVDSRINDDRRIVIVAIRIPLLRNAGYVTLPLGFKQQAHLRSPAVES